MEETYTQRLGMKKLVLSHPRKAWLYIWGGGGEEVGVSKLCGRDVHTETRNEGTSTETSYNKCLDVSSYSCNHMPYTQCI